MCHTKKIVLRYFLVIGSLCLASVGVWFLYEQSYGAPPMQAKNTALKVGDPSLYPIPSLTPGDILTTDPAIICQPTYYRSVKDVSDEVKKAAYKIYNTPYSPKGTAYELDRYIPIELGGSNNSKNLWPEKLGPIGYKEKNSVENFLHAQVCTHQMTLVEAQEKMRTDWYAVYLTIAH